MIDSIRRSHLSTGNLLWLAAYVATIAAMVLGLFAARRRLVDDLSRPEALAEWREWKQAADELRETQSAGQRKPKLADEPPTLILMRDCFGVILAGSLVIGSVLFGFFALTLRGAFGRRAEGTEDDDSDGRSARREPKRASPSPPGRGPG